MAKKPVSGRSVLLGSQPEMTKEGESGRVVGFRPRTCVHALSQDGRQVVLPPLSLMPLAKLPIIRAALPLPGLTKMPYETGLCPDAVGCGPLSRPGQASTLAERYLESTVAGQCKVPGSRCPSALRMGTPPHLPVRVWEEDGSWKPVASACVGLPSVGLSVSPHHAFGFPDQPSTRSPPLSPHSV